MVAGIGFGSAKGRAVMFAGLLVLAAAGGAGAQSLATLESCIARHGVAAPSQTAEACSKQLYDACIARKGSETTLDISDCLQQSHGVWDQLLNKLWGPMKARAQAAGTWESLLASQRTWIAYRDARCQQEYDDYAGGTMRFIAPVACQNDMTAEKAMEFYRTLSQ